MLSMKMLSSRWSKKKMRNSKFSSTKTVCDQLTTWVVRFRVVGFPSSSWTFNSLLNDHSCNGCLPLLAAKKDKQVRSLLMAWKSTNAWYVPKVKSLQKKLLEFMSVLLHNIWSFMSCLTRVFKHHNTYFYTLFHPYVFLQNLNNVTRNLLLNISFVSKKHKTCILRFTFTAQRVIKSLLKFFKWYELV